MFKRLFAVGLLLVSGASMAQKQVDCSKMTPGQVRLVDDIETTCKKAAKPTAKDAADLIKKASTDAKRMIADTFKDPDSVKFRDLRISKDGAFVCGELNAKNSYGGYVGYTRFYSLWAVGLVHTEGSATFIESYLTNQCGYENTKPFK